MKNRVYFRLACCALIVLSCLIAIYPTKQYIKFASTEPKNDFIKWIDFNASAETIHKTIALVNHLDNEPEYTKADFYDILSYLSIQNGNKFERFSDNKVLKTLKTKLEKGINPIENYKDNKNFKYFVESNKAVLGGIVGYINDDDTGLKHFGIIGYHPITKGYWYNNFDDFGNSRIFGYKRLHLGNDLFGNIGTPIMAIEGGTIQELGWNRFGGWRIGIRSHDTKRYYYYAHLRNKNPYPKELKKGDTVTAGQLIGFLGNTGYGKEGSTIKNAKPHLHLGLQIIFDPSQEKGPKEIWVDVYQLVRLLYNYRAIVD